MFDFDELEVAEDKADACASPPAEQVPAAPMQVVIGGEATLPPAMPETQTAKVQPAIVQGLPAMQSLPLANREEALLSCETLNSERKKVKLVPTAPAVAKGDTSSAWRTGALAPKAEPVKVQLHSNDDKGSSASLSTAASDVGNVTSASNVGPCGKSGGNVEHAQPTLLTQITSPKAKAAVPEQEKHKCFAVASRGLWKMFFGTPAELPH